ncbi:MAG TPA: hypothetical protein VMH04_05255 [Candidatus Solibacter sp.]|nr:hypothetical protein [Candidatus Solibacter sp.]
MSTGSGFLKSAGIAVLCLGSAVSVFAGSEHGQRKPKKPQAPPLASGPTGPVPQVPLDSISPMPPTVSYENGQLTIVAPNSTLGDILRAVKKQTGAEIEIPTAGDRVVTHLGPGPARDVMAELLNGSRFNYVILGSPEDSKVLTHIVLVPKSPEAPNANNNIVAQQPPQQQAMMQPGNMAPPPPQEMAQDADADQTAEENADDAAPDQATAEADQQQQPTDPNGVKTPQQMLQEMQQRQMQLQQNQPPGQPPVPGTGLPPRPPQEP